MKIRAWYACLLACFLWVLPVNPAWALTNGLPDTPFCPPIVNDPSGERFKESNKKADINLEVLQTQIEIGDGLSGNLHEAKSEALDEYLGCIKFLSYVAKDETEARLDADLAKLVAFFEKHEAVPEVRVFMLSELLFKVAERTKDAGLISQLRTNLNALIEEGQAIEYKPREEYNEAYSKAYIKRQADALKAEKNALVSELLANAAGAAALAGDSEDAKTMLGKAVTLNGENTEAISLLASLEAPEQVAPVSDVQLNYDLLGSKVRQVWDLEFSPDGTKLLVLCNDGTYREWDWMAGRIARFGTPPKPMHVEYDMGYLSDVNAFYVIGNSFADGTDIDADEEAALEVWDPDSQSVMFTSTSDMDFQVPANAGFIVRQNTDKVSFIDPADGAEIRDVKLTFTGKYRFIDEVVSEKGLRQSGEFDTFAVSDDGSKFIERGFPAQHVVAFGDTQTGKVKKILMDEFGFGYSGIKLSADASIVAVSNYETLAVALIDTKSAKQIATLRGHSKGISDMIFSDGGTRLVTMSKDLRAIVWDVATGKKILELPKFTNELSSGDFSPDGKYFVTGGADGAARIWEVATGKLMAAYYAIEDKTVASANGLALLANGRFAANGVDGEMLTIAGKPVSPEQLKSLSYGQALPAGLFTP